MLVAGNPIGQIDLSCQSTISKQLHGSINGGIPNAWIPLANGAIDILDTPVPFIANKVFQNKFAMRSELLFLLLEILQEDLHLGRDRLHGPTLGVGSSFRTSL